MSEGGYRHATAVVIGEAGLLIRGASGSGKSRLADALIETARRRGDFARLVGDDRVAVENRAGRLVATGHPSVAGLIERRGIGIVGVDHLGSVVLRGVIDLEAASRRLPEAAEASVPIAGVGLPRLALVGGDEAASRAAMILDWLDDLLAIAKELG